MQLSQRRRTLQRTGSTAKASKCFGAVISSPEPPKETVLRCCTLLYKPAKTCAFFADSLAVLLSYRCSTRSKASVRKLCLLPPVLNDIRFSCRSCFRSFERKILRRERLLLSPELAAEWTSSNNGYTTVRRKTVRSATVRRETVRRATIRRGPFSPLGPVRRLTITPLAA